jgi:hypothetical protein
MRGSAAFRTAIASGGVLAGPWVKNELWRRAKAIPSLDLRFAENKSLVDATTGQNLVTFTRASSGTFVGSDGLIKTATTNLLLRSEEFDNASWTKTRSSVTAGAITAPNGTTTADTLIEDSSASATHFISQGVSITSGTNYAFSVFIKRASGSRNANLRWNGGFDAGNMTVDLTTGAVTASSALQNPSATAFSNGWWRVSFGQAATSTGTFGPQIFLHDGTGISYTGDGTSGIYIWGAQLEQSSTVGEYIPTTSTINSAPRFDHNPTTGESLGLLVEESRTNLVTWSQDFSQTDWSKNASTIVSTAIASPISGVNYQKIEASTANTTVGVTSIAVSAATQQRAVSFFARPLGNITRVLIVVQGADARINVNLIDGTATTNATATGSTVTVSGERFTVSTPSLTNATGVRFFLKRTGETDTNTPTTIAIGEGLYLTGAQMEAGSFPTSYIPTTTATVTRSADVASISGSNFSGWYRADEGTVFADNTSYAINNTRIASFSDNTTSNRVLIARGSGSGGNINITVTVDGTVQVSSFVFASSLGANTALKVAGGFKASDFAGSVNGAAPTTRTSGSMATTVNQLGIGNGEVLGTNTFSGTIRRLTYWPQRLPNSTLQEITQ